MLAGLRPYQLEIANAVLDSILHRKGLTFSVEIARQGGKNEISARLERLLLTLNMDQSLQLIKCSPTFKPQTVISMQRLKDRLNDAGFNGSWISELGYIIRLGEARAVFLSADTSSNVVGNTAHLLLEVDESQDVAKDKYTKEFKPMTATTNCTVVHYGTTWDDSTLLEEIKQTNLELEKKDGIQRHFRYDYQDVGKYNPDYLLNVEMERQRIGENHPLFLTQYRLLPVHGGGGFLNYTQRAQLQGSHSRLHSPEPGKIYIAGIDLAGETEAGEGYALKFLKPHQDSTVLTIGEVCFVEAGDQLSLRADKGDTEGFFYSPALPYIRIVEHYSWTGVKHTNLYPRLVDLLKNVWHCKKIVVDSTGVGEPVAAFLKGALGSRVVPFKFTSQSKSALGFNLLAAVNSGRLKMYAADGSTEYQAFWRQIESAKSVYRPNRTFNFFVDPSDGHDDFLMSLALLIEAAGLYQPRVARGRQV
jgi:hypothetical protein